MSSGAKIGLGIVAAAVVIGAAYQAYVGAAILGLLLDSVCWIFPVCPKP